MNNDLRPSEENVKDNFWDGFIVGFLFGSITIGLTLLNLSFGQ